MPGERKTVCDRSETMRRVRCRNTSLEMLLRRALWRSGLRYRLNVALDGKPDLVFARARVAVFVDSCFWHNCPDHCRPPRSRQEYWLPKLERNRRRDAAVNEILAERGWRVVRVWEHDLKRSLDPVVASIRSAVAARRQRLS